MTSVWNQKRMYGVDVSPALVSKVTDGILKGAHRLGRTGRLTGVIPFVYIDAMVVKV